MIGKQIGHMAVKHLIKKLEELKVLLSMRTQTAFSMGRPRKTKMVCGY
ncbi:MAG: hypothetical protein VB082_10715 [Christensenella sp.]|nr:hypothetical protein [Christensenella sp.]